MGKGKDREFYGKLAGLVLPIAVQNLMTALVSASDALMLGFLNQDSLSALSLAPRCWRPNTGEKATALRWSRCLPWR